MSRASATQTDTAGHAALRDRLRRHVAYLAETVGPRHMDAPGTLATTADYIERELVGIAGEPVQRHRFPVGNDHAENLILERPASGADDPDRAQPVVIVGAHYDTVPESPGADDNASAVAMLIELARLLTPPSEADGAGNRRGSGNGGGVRFVAFANEEAPHHNMGTMGSEHYLRYCLHDDRTPIAAMLCLEMVGYYRTDPASQRIPPALPRLARWVLPSRGDFIAAVSNPHSIGLLLRFRRGYRRAMRTGSTSPGVRLLPIALPERIRDITRSDHRPFWEAGLPALMLTDTSYLRNPHYHMPSDTVDTLDYERLARATVATAGGVAAVARMKNTPAPQREGV